MTTDIKGLADLSAIECQGQKLIVDHHGAKVLGLFFHDNNVLFYDEEDIAHSGIPLCFPSFGPLKNGEFLHNGKNYPMKQHGFARDFVFDLIERGENFLTFELKSSAQTLERFPFEFTFQVRYTLASNSLKIDFDCKNNSTEKLPLAPGVHPYFSVDDAQKIFFTSKATKGNNNLQNYDAVPAKDILPVSQENGVLLYQITGTPDLHLIDHGLHETLIKPGKLSPLKMTADAEVFKRMAIWRNSENAGFICIEPANVQNALNEKAILVESGESFKTQVSITAVE